MNTKETITRGQWAQLSLEKSIDFISKFADLPERLSREEAKNLVNQYPLPTFWQLIEFLGDGWEKKITQSKTGQVIYVLDKSMSVSLVRIDKQLVDLLWDAVLRKYRDWVQPIVTVSHESKLPYQIATEVETVYGADQETAALLNNCFTTNYIDKDLFEKDLRKLIDLKLDIFELTDDKDFQRKHFADDILNLLETYSKRGQLNDKL